ncbi:MAG TPA: hypothetical protein EYQ74_04910 [Planctomycetes bacterium]|nr:hypothetical protein [Planctomycetota bacterium]HIK60733.1 hypothetical protein [Planctomycetota bacterium]
MSRVQEFGMVTALLEETLDWVALGHEYCHDGGEAFFEGEQREAIREAGFLMAADLKDSLGALPDDSPGQSLWVGAAVAELVPILTDHLVLGRTVHWHNIDCAETTELNRALEFVERETGVALPRINTQRCPTRDRYDLLWVVSVLTDPDAFPALHFHFYERQDAAGIVRPGQLDEEGKRAEEWTRNLLGQLAVPGVLVTTDEEFGFFKAAADADSRSLVVPQQGRLSGIVGDLVRFYPVDQG